jgi:hypothetical protein
MTLTELINQQYQLLLTDPNYSIPQDIEMDIEDQSGIYRDFCTDTDKYLDTQIEWIEFIINPNYN